jgi:CBS domain-containing protein
METVRELLDKKGRKVWSIKPDAPVFEAIKLLDRHGIGALVVLDRQKLVGIVSERDYARKVILKDKSSKRTPVREIMTPDVLWVTPEWTVEDCLALMTEKRVRHLPVLEGDKLSGIVSIGDVARATIAKDDFLIGQLTNYISGG